MGYGDRFILMRVRDEKAGIAMEYKLPEGWNRVGVINDRNPGSG